jgi:hypothetical protein
VLPNGVNPKDQYTKQVDIFAFGLCVLELATKKKLDSSNCAIWPELLQSVQDEDARAFISRCAFYAPPISKIFPQFNVSTLLLNSFSRCHMVRRFCFRER